MLFPTLTVALAALTAVSMAAPAPNSDSVRGNDVAPRARLQPRFATEPIRHILVRRNHCPNYACETADDCEPYNCDSCVFDMQLRTNRCDGPTVITPGLGAKPPGPKAPKPKTTNKKKEKGGKKSTGKKGKKSSGRS